MAMATSAASNSRVFVPGANLPRARFGVADLRARAVLVFAFALPMGYYVALKNRPRKVRCTATLPALRTPSRAAKDGIVLQYFTIRIDQTHRGAL